MKKLLFAVLASTATFFTVQLKSVAAPVHTQIEFGRYINCIVVNHLTRPIRINYVTYQVTGYYGRASSQHVCVANCLVIPGGVNKMSGPANNPNITKGICNVNYSIV